MRMRKVLVTGSWIAGVAVVVSLAFFFAGRPAAGVVATVYKSPTCGCCKGWVAHMKRNGYTVKAYDVKDLTPLKTRHGVPSRLTSCHTALVGGYVIEGHVPARDIQRLLRERPEIKGLAVPGMPMGSPGMEGPRKDRYQVFSFEKDGNTAVYASY